MKKARKPNGQRSFAHVLAAVQDRFDCSQAEAAAALADGLLKHPELPLYRQHPSQRGQPLTIQYELLHDPERADVLRRWRAAVLGEPDTTGRMRPRELATDAEHVEMLMQEAGLEVVPLYAGLLLVDTGPAAPLPDTTVAAITDSLCDHSLAPDALAALLDALAEAVAEYGRITNGAEYIPPTQQTRARVTAVTSSVEALRDALGNIDCEPLVWVQLEQRCAHHGLPLHELDDKLVALRQAADWLRQRLDETPVGRRPDEAAPVLARAVVAALRAAGLKPAASRDGLLVKTLEALLHEARRQVARYQRGGGSAYELACAALHDP